MTNPTQDYPQECCPKFDPQKWDNKTFTWENKKFIKDKVFTFFYIPIGFGSVITKLDKKIHQSGATFQEGLLLSDHPSKWRMDVYMAVDKEVPGLNNTTLSGKFLSRVYEGDFKDTGKWCKDFEDHVKTKNLKIRKWFMWYTTCPKCAKKYGKNYVAIVGKIE